MICFLVFVQVGVSVLAMFGSNWAGASCCVHRLFALGHLNLASWVHG